MRTSLTLRFPHASLVAYIYKGVKRSTHTYSFLFSFFLSFIYVIIIVIVIIIIIIIIVIVSLYSFVMTRLTEENTTMITSRTRC